MREEADIQLVRPLDGSVVTGKITVGVTVDEVDEAVGLWSPYLEEQLKADVSRPQHAHWKWEVKARRVQGMSNYVICGVADHIGLQALMLREDICARAKHPDQIGAPIAYVAFVAAAPWNDRELVPTPAYSGCGTLLIREAIEHSISLGYRGRLGLHSLRQAEEFDRDRCQMTDLGPDPAPDHQGLRYFEFTKEAAKAFLTKIKGRKPS